MRAPSGPQGRVSTFMRRTIPGAGGGRTNLIAPVAPVRSPKTEPVLATGGARFATLVIAANDSTAVGKAAADYVCDGTADDVEIQAAIDSLGTDGGHIILLEGTFNLAATIASSANAPLWIDGCGANDTYLVGSNARATINRGSHDDWFRLSNIHFINGGPAVTWQTVSLGVTIDNCWFEGCTQAILSVYVIGHTYLDYYVKIVDNVFQSCGGIGINGVIELQQRTSHLLIAGNSFDITDGSTSYEAFVTSGDTGNKGDYAVIANNQASRKGLFLAYHQGCTIVGNAFNGDVTIDHVADIAIAGNLCWGTYAATNTTGTIALAGNVGIP